MSVELELILVDDPAEMDAINEEGNVPRAPINVWYMTGQSHDGSVMYYESKSYFGHFLMQDINGELWLLDYMEDRSEGIDRLYQEILWERVQPSVRITHSCSYP